MKITISVPEDVVEKLKLNHGVVLDVQSIAGLIAGAEATVVEEDKMFPREHVIERLKLLGDTMVTPKVAASVILMPKVIDRKMCASSNVQSYGYDQFSKTLAVMFKGTPTEYRYLNVDSERFNELEESKSKGKVIHGVKILCPCIKVPEGGIAG
jgi:hypothetical protein